MADKSEISDDNYVEYCEAQEAAWRILKKRARASLVSPPEETLTEVRADSPESVEDFIARKEAEESESE